MASRSRHPGGIQLVRSDGSVDFVSDDVLIDVWHASSTTQGNEVISGDSE